MLPTAQEKHGILVEYKNVKGIVRTTDVARVGLWTRSGDVSQEVGKAL